MTLARLALATALLAIVAWIVAWRRARPDLCPLWLAAKLSLLLASIAVAAVSAIFDPPVYFGAVVVADVVGAAVAVRLWLHRRQLLGPVVAAEEARRLAEAGLAMADVADREGHEGSRHHGG